MDVKIQEVILEVCNEFGVGFDEIIAQNRKIEIVQARNEAMLRLNTKLKMSCSAIGRLFKKSHATVIHAWKEAEKHRATHINTNEFIESLLVEKRKLTKRLDVINNLISSYE